MPLELTPKQPPYYETGDAISIRQYIAIITQTGTAAPTATELKNTLGQTVTWTRSGVGIYTATVPEPLFLENKTHLLATANGDTSAAVLARTGDVTITYATFNEWTLTDDGTASIQITIYP